MHSSGFANAPMSKYLVLWIVSASILASSTDMKHYFYIQVVPHLWPYKQIWRFFVWPVCYTNATEVIFAALTVYQLRLIERLWGSRKFASFLIATAPYTILLPPIFLALLRPLTGNNVNYLPAGPTSLIFAILAQYHAAIPYTYRYRVATSLATTVDHHNQEPNGIVLTSKSMSYLLPIQLALSQLPGSLIPAVIGWIVGYAWRVELLPVPSSRWRIPKWLYSRTKTGLAGGNVIEGLMRRMEDEVAGSASGINGAERDAIRRRP